VAFLTTPADARAPDRISRVQNKGGGVGRAWHVAVSPRRSDMPVMRKHSFDIRASSLDEAVSNVRTRIDLLLDILR
jgi:hypothetical protein